MPKAAYALLAVQWHELPIGAPLMVTDQMKRYSWRSLFFEEKTGDFLSKDMEKAKEKMRQKER